MCFQLYCMSVRACACESARTCACVFSPFALVGRRNHLLHPTPLDLSLPDKDAPGSTRGRCHLHFCDHVVRLWVPVHASERATARLGGEQMPSNNHTNTARHGEISCNIGLGLAVPPFQVIRPPRKRLNHHASVSRLFLGTRKSTSLCVCVCVCARARAYTCTHMNQFVMPTPLGMTHRAIHSCRAALYPAP